MHEHTSMISLGNVGTSSSRNMESWGITVGCLFQQVNS